MQLRDLEYFAAVAEHGNLRRAAEALDLSQPALSKSLRRLEKSAQGKLVKRTPKGVELTAVGSALLTHARRLRLSLDDAERELVDLSQGRVGHLRVGAGPLMAEDILPVACATLFRAAPNVTLKVVVANNDVLMPALRRGELDVTASGIPTSPYEDLVQEYLYEDEFVVVTSADHLLARKKVVTITDLTGERWVLAPANVLSGQWLRRAFSDRGLPAPRVAMEASATRLRMHMVSSCGFLDFAARSTLSQAMQHYRLVELPVKELAWRRSVGVSYRKDAYLSPTAHRFVDILKATAKKTNVAKNR